MGSKLTAEQRKSESGQPSSLATQQKKSDSGQLSNLATQQKKSDSGQLSNLATQQKKRDSGQPSSLATQQKKSDSGQLSNLATQQKNSDSGQLSNLATEEKKSDSGQQRKSLGSKWKRSFPNRKQRGKLSHDTTRSDSEQQSRYVATEQKKNDSQELSSNLTAQLKKSDSGQHRKSLTRKQRRSTSKKTRTGLATGQLSNLATQQKTSVFRLLSSNLATNQETGFGQLSNFATEQKSDNLASQQRRSDIGQLSNSATEQKQSGSGQLSNSATEQRRSDSGQPSNNLVSQQRRSDTGQLSNSATQQKRSNTGQPSNNAAAEQKRSESEQLSNSVAAEQEKCYDPNDTTLSFVDGDDDLDFECNDYKSLRAKMSCGHAVTPMSLTKWCRRLLDEGECRFVCGQTGCDVEWTYEEVCKMALLTPDEMDYFEKKLPSNAAKNYFDVKSCPGCKCSVVRTDLDNLRVCCPVCTANKNEAFSFCWQCLNEWKRPSPYSDRCANKRCINKSQEILMTCPDITFKDVRGVTGCPCIRACPTCGLLVEHDKTQCKNVVCQRCKVEFCFVCLKLTEECLKLRKLSYYILCSSGVAPRQTSIPVWKRK